MPAPPEEQLHIADAMGAVQDLDCVSVEVEAHGPFGCVVHRHGHWPTISRKLTGFPSRQLLPDPLQGLPNVAHRSVGVSRRTAEKDYPPLP